MASNYSLRRPVLDTGLGLISTALKSQAPHQVRGDGNVKVVGS